MQEHFCRLQPSLGPVPLSARYSTYTDRFQGTLPVSPTMSPFTDLRRHRPHRQLSSSPPLRHSFSSVPHDDASQPAANSSSIVFNPTAVGPLYATFAIDFASPRQPVFFSPA